MRLWLYLAFAAEESFAWRSPNMSTTASPQRPPGFSWLPLAFRPSAQEVENYARVITTAEGEPPEMIDRHLREALLQLWIWRYENGRHSRLRFVGRRLAHS